MPRTFKDSDDARKATLATQVEANSAFLKAGDDLSAANGKVQWATSAEAADLKAIGGKAVLPNADGTFTTFVSDTTKPEGFAIDTYVDGSVAVIPDPASSPTAD